MTTTRYKGGILCSIASVMLMFCALHLTKRESGAAGLFVGLVALGLLFAATKSLRAAR